MFDDHAHPLCNEPTDARANPYAVRTGIGSLDAAVNQYARTRA